MTLLDFGASHSTPPRPPSACGASLTRRLVGTSSVSSAVSSHSSNASLYWWQASVYRGARGCRKPVLTAKSFRSILLVSPIKPSYDAVLPYCILLTGAPNDWRTKCGKFPQLVRMSYAPTIYAFWTFLLL